MLSRRLLLLVAGLSLGSWQGQSAHSAKSRTRHPDRRHFQSGDLVWTAAPGAIIPYDSSVGASEAQRRQQWNSRKTELVEQLRNNPDPAKRELVARLRRLNYEQFVQLYAQNIAPRPTVPFSGDILGVGHVAIVERDPSGALWVIEASPRQQGAAALFGRSVPNGVRRDPYRLWLRAHQDDQIWHGRVKGLTPAKAEGIAAQAKRYLGRAYDFWNFDLLDSNAFYCSKLIWLSARQATGISICGDDVRKQRLWLSPKQLLNCRDQIDVRFSPATYGGYR